MENSNPIFLPLITTNNSRFTVENECNGNGTKIKCPESILCDCESSDSKISPNGSNSSKICRICHDGDGMEILIAPCNCTGTVALIHASCLERWLTSSSTDKCELCKHQFKTVMEPRNCVEYIQDSSNQFNVRNLIADIICFFLLTPLLVISTYLCAIGAKQYFVRERWEAIGLVLLSFFLLAVYYTWCHVTLKFHISVYRKWRQTHQRVRLVEALTNLRSSPVHNCPWSPVVAADNNTIQSAFQLGFSSLDLNSLEVNRPNPVPVHPEYTSEDFFSDTTPIIT